ncbi:MAG: gamma-glutamyl-gamma-aminobutyrate hydrolase family protein [Candidatus Omnitrophica bacterium]|nr:gamma-glutamyl-gamma-aminobutyrate hydrolase family protein [Candidatus Omnitrophota bacterium]
MVRKKTAKPVIGISCEVLKLKPYFSEFELACDYRYIRAIIRAGGIPLMLPINHNLEDLRKLLLLVDGLLIIGGADIPPSFYGERERHKVKPMYRGRTRFDMNLYKMAHRMRIPVFAICYGMQLLNVIYGGTLYQDIQKQIRSAKNHQSRRSPIHTVHLEEGSMLAKLLGRKDFPVHSQHHQAVKRLGRSLRAIGYSPDWIIEALEGPRNALAVQWHPERQERDTVQRKLFAQFVRMCKGKK